MSSAIWLPRKSKIEAAQPLFLQRDKNTVPVALCWVALHAHQGDRITQIQKPMQVSTEIRDHHAFVIPIPNGLARARIDCTSANVTGHAFGDSASHGVIVKTYNVTHLVKEAQGRYSPAAVVAVAREVVSGDADQYVSTSYVERQNLSLRMGQRRFTRLTNGFSKKLDNHVAAVALYVAHYNLCRVHEALRMTPAKALGVIDRNWSIGDLIDAALATQPITPVTTAPDRRKLFTVVQGGRK
jgi:hypothetical protein